MWSHDQTMWYCLLTKATCVMWITAKNSIIKAPGQGNQYCRKHPCTWQAIKCWTIFGLKETMENLKQPNAKRPPSERGLINVAIYSFVIGNSCVAQLHSLHPDDSGMDTRAASISILPTEISLFFLNFKEINVAIYSFVIGNSCVAQLHSLHPDEIWNG